MNKKWKLKEKNENYIKKIVEKYNVSELLANILASKQIVEDKDIDIFLNPTRNDFHDPFLLPDMKEAVDRIVKAIDNKENIVVYGDYDADGITSTTILKKFFKDRGVDIKTYIPNRLDEGYGLNLDAIDQIAKENCKLMITVDCGITAVKEVDYAISKNIDVIITDHHEPLDQLPGAISVIDAKRKDSKYPFSQLAGCGVAFKLIQAIGIRLNLKQEQWLKYLDIVCVGTISDIVPLLDENRVIAKLGLKLVNVTKNVGLKALLNAAGIKKIDSSAISFGIAPRINACGRMGHQEDALELFLTEDPIDARNLANKLNEYNKKRQETEKKIYEEALKKIEEKKDKSCLVIGGEDWHDGVIGIVSSKITELCFKPSILLSYHQNEAKGSGRSIPGFDLHQAVGECSKYLSNFGGHSMAIGLKLEKSNVPYFEKALNEYAKIRNIEDIVPIIEVDDSLKSQDITKENVEQLSLLEPFGEANKPPIFMYSNLKITSIRSLSDGKHLKLTVKDDNLNMDCIGFNLGGLVENYQIGDNIDLVGSLEINRFQGNETVQMNIKDIRKAV